VAGPQKAQIRTAELKEHLDAFQHALAVQPFGDPERSAPAARAIAGWSEAVLDDLRRSSLNRDHARALLGQLCRMVRERTPDYDSARQIAWAFRAIYRELDPGPTRDTSINRRLVELDRELLLMMPIVRDKTPGESTLAKRLRAIADYNPVTFRAQFAGLEHELSTLARP
jgi:hypothetical protein